MNVERKLTIIYFVLGVGMGVISKYIDALLSLAIAIAVYAISAFVLRRQGEGKKLSWYVLNTLLTFVLVWIVTWIFVFNLG